MNDDIREKLSAYLDGALSDEQRRAVEVEISRSEETRLELEALRAVSESVKGLGKAKLPEGFMARLQARRACESAPPRGSYRPLALAISTAVIALVVWDRTRPPRELLKPLPDWDGGGVALQSTAPASIGAAGSLSTTDAKEKAPEGGGVAPMRLDESKMSKPSSGSVPLLRAASEESRLNGRRRTLSAIRGSAARGTAAKFAAPAALAKPAAPAVNAVALKSASALQAAWTAAGLPGKPPFVDFSAQMAVFLAGPPGAGIVSVQDHNTSIVVLYKDSGFADAFARVRAVTPSQKPLTVKRAD